MCIVMVSMVTVSMEDRDQCSLAHTASPTAIHAYISTTNYATHTSETSIPTLSPMANLILILLLG